MEKNYDHLIRTTYQKYLFREPDVKGYSHFLHLLKTKQLDEIEFINVIKSSDECNRKQKADYFNKQKNYVFTGKYDLKYNIRPNSILDFLVTQNGICDASMIAQIKKFTSSSSVVFDVGSNAGLLSLPIAKYVVPDGKVYSFEPDPELYNQLCQNIELNNLQNIITEKYALQDDSSLNTVKLHKRRAIHDDGRTNFGLSTIQNNSEYVVGFHFVPTTTIDAFVIFQNISNIDLIKIDVEGAEFNVMSGAKNSIKKFHPIIIYEFSREIDKLTNTTNTKNCFDFITQQEYSQYLILNSQKLELIENYDESLPDSDVLCIPNLPQ
jgi:FkbM family methyltransferase